MTAEDHVYNVLFLDTANSSRSLMAEALLNVIGKGRFKAYSAGSHPRGTVNPYTIELISKTGYPLEKLSSKSWVEFANINSPVMDFVITLCSHVAKEKHPVWPGAPVTAFWPFDDPASIEGTEDEKRQLFQKVFRFINTRVQLFASLPLHNLGNLTLKQELDYIGDLRHVSS